MPIVVKENFTGRQRSGRNAQRTYYITGAADETEALNALLSDAECPDTIGDLPRYNSECTAEELEAGRFLGTAVYRLADMVQFQAPETFSISFDINGQSQRITQSKITYASYAPPTKTAKNFRGAINVQQDGTIEGVEILFPFLNYTVTYTFTNDEITTSFVNTLSKAVGTVNDDGFHGYEGGELLLTRASGQKRSDGSGNWDIAFGFAVSRNKTTFVVNPGAPTAEQITVAPSTGKTYGKQGWDYLWVYYEANDVTLGGITVVHKTPVSAYVEQVYDYTDFSLLGIGT